MSRLRRRWYNLTNWRRNAALATQPSVSVPAKTAANLMPTRCNGTDTLHTKTTQHICASKELMQQKPFFLTSTKQKIASGTGQTKYKSLTFGNTRTLAAIKHEQENYQTIHFIVDNFYYRL